MNNEDYRFDRGRLYKWAPKQNAYVLVFTDHRCQTKAEAIAKLNQMDMFDF